MICLPKPVSDTLLKAIKSRQIDLRRLSEMPSADRRTVFSQIVGKDSAESVNALFESKLALKNQEAGMITFIRQAAGLTSPVARDMVSRISKLDHVLNPDEQKQFLADYASKKIGATITSDQAAKISELAKTASDLKDKNPKLSGVSDEFLKAQNDLKSHVEGLKTNTVAQSLGQNLAVIGRNNLLLNPATPLKTAISSVVNTGMDMISRRLAMMSTDTTNPDLVKQANSEAWETFRKTGDNTAQMESLDDTHVLNKGENFKTVNGETTGGKVINATSKAVGKIAQISNKVAIDWEHNIAFTKFYQNTFFDMVGLASDKVADTEGLMGGAAKSRAADVLKDAARIQPKTSEGAMVRQMAQEQAARITSTNDTFASRLATGAKNMLNKVIPGFKLGNFIEPMAKIPANVIANGIDNAGFGLPKSVYDIYQGRTKMASDDLQTKYEGMAQFSDGLQHLIRVGGTIGVSALIASQIPANKFRSDNYGNHFIEIGNTWINMEYIAAISPALAGFLTAKQNKGSIGNDIYQYGAGAAAGLKNVPGANEINSLLNTDIKKYATTFFTSRGEPAFISNLLNNRPIQRLFFGATGVESNAQVKADASAKAKATAAKAKATRAANKAKT
jgi:hypothetical protein